LPRLLGELPARPARAWLGQQRPEVSKPRQPRPGPGEHRREQPAQLIVQLPQPAAIFYDGRGGHLLILSSHKSMIIQMAVSRQAEHIMIIQALHHEPGL
jgi:hypothetical protein